MKNNHLELFWRQCWEQEAFSVQLFQARMRFFTTALPGTGAVTVQAEASNSFGGSGSEEDDSYQDFAASEFSLVLTRRIFTDEEESQLLDKLEAITGNTIWKWQLPQ